MLKTCFFHFDTEDYIGKGDQIRIQTDLMSLMGQKWVLRSGYSNGGGGGGGGGDFGGACLSLGLGVVEAVAVVAAPAPPACTPYVTKGMWASILYGVLKDGVKWCPCKS